MLEDQALLKQEILCTKEIMQTLTLEKLQKTMMAEMDLDKFLLEM
jgi:hypothetical protein